MTASLRELCFDFKSKPNAHHIVMRALNAMLMQSNSKACVIAIFQSRSVYGGLNSLNKAGSHQHY
jgi:hypothetical protein